jgi:hypothetical protein
MNDFVIQAINDCRNNASLAREIMSLYTRLEQEQSKPGDVRVRCLGGGTCCRFDRLGHRLWASCGEIALLLGTSHKPAAGNENVMRIANPDVSGSWRPAHTTVATGPLPLATWAKMPRQAVAPPWLPDILLPKAV